MESFFVKYGMDLLEKYGIDSLFVKYGIESFFVK